MEKFRPYMKAVVAAAIPAGFTILAAVIDVSLVDVDPEVAGIIIAALTSIGVYRVPNKEIS